MDTIDRQAAIDAVSEGCQEWRGIFERCKEKLLSLPSAQLDYDLSGYSDKLWKAAYERGKAEAQPEQRWIPVTKQLPNPNEYDERKVRRYYLIQNEYGDMMVAAYLGNVNGETWWNQMYANKPIEDKVVAWMPLPKPWKGDDDE